MRTPPAFTMDGGPRDLVAHMGVADIVTTDERGAPHASRLPLVWHEDRLILHMATANPQWRSMDSKPGLAIVNGPEGYITPSWYAAKAEYGRVVPTWNYSAVHLSGRVTVHHDPDWVLDAS